MILESAIGGLFGAITPIFTKWLDNKEKVKEREHEFKMTELQLQIDEARSKLKIDELYAQGNIDEINAQWKALLETAQSQANMKSGIGWIDGLNTLIRPLLTFWWCIVLYTVYKAMLIKIALSTNVDFLTLATTIVTDFDGAVISAIIGFWFVNRQLANMKLRG